MDVLLDSCVIGRERQHERLCGWITDLVAGHGRSILVEGEPGIGKSTLLRVAAAEAGEAGCQVLRGDCDELNRAFPLLPLLDALGVLTQEATDPVRAAITAQLRAAPGAGFGVDPVVAATEQVLALVDEVCGVAPTILLLDDLQWADPATVTAWSRLSRAVRQLPLLLVGSVRPVPPREDLTALRRLAGVVRLASLDPADATRLVATLAGGLPGQRLTRLALGAGGNPLYLTELVTALARGGRLVPDTDGVEVTAGAVPTSLPAAIADRLAFLSTSARGVLRAAALLGVDFSVTELAVVLDRQVTELLPALDESIMAGVLREDGARLAFRHPLIRTALYQGMPLALRSAWHRGAARALAASGAQPERVARQLLPVVEAGGADPGQPAEPGQTDDWMVAWLAGAAQPLVARAPQVAIPLLRQALAAAHPETPQLTLLACRLADVLFRVGRIDEAIGVATRALERVDDPDLLVDLHSTLAQARAIEGRNEQPLAGLEVALATAGLPAKHRARLLVLVARVQRSLGRVEQAAEVAAEALAEATAAGDPWATGWALAILSIVRGMRGDIAGTLPLFERALVVTEGEPALSDLRLVLQINQANSLAYLDRHDEAVAAAREVRRAADRAGNVVRLRQAESLLVGLLFDIGQWDEALAGADDGDHPQRVSCDPVVECFRHGIAATIQLHQGEAAGAELAAAGEVAALLGHRVVYPLALATSLDLERSGAPDRALGVLLEALSRSAEEQAETAPLLAETVRLAVLLDEAGSAAAATLRAAGLAGDGASPHRTATVLHCQGLVDNDPQRLVAAAEHYAAAGRPLPRAQALAAAGLAAAGRGDGAMARTRFTEAFAAFEALGAHWDISRLQAQFREYGIRRGPQVKHRRADHGWESLTPSEVKIATQVALGMTNPQIAARLFLSRRTVQSHVSHILTKLRVHSRMEIAREVTRRGGLPGDGC